jgi:hypothetical protein
MPNWESLRRTERVSSTVPSGGRSEGEGARWHRLFGSGREGQSSNDSMLPGYDQPVQAPDKKHREQLYKEANLQFAKPKEGLRKSLASRLAWGKDDRRHPIHRKRAEQAHDAMMSRQLAETEDMSARPEGWNPQGQASRSDVPPAYGPSPDRRE